PRASGTPDAINLFPDGGRVTLVMWRWQGKASPAKALTVPLAVSIPAVRTSEPLRCAVIHRRPPATGLRASPSCRKHARDPETRATGHQPHSPGSPLQSSDRG